VCTKDFNDFRTIQLDFKNIGIDPTSVEIEAITIYKNELWFTDESTSNHRLYSYNLNSRQLDTIYSGPYLDEDTTSFGMEGITVDSINRICYVLKEKNYKNQSVIRVFKILELENRVHLEFIRNIYIELPDIRWRYSDLCFNANDNYLYCLKTRKGKYKIDTIYASNLHERGDITIPLKKNNEFKDISQTINSYGKTGYDTNMEGLVMTTEAIYVVSDNAQTKNLNCATPGQKKTLLIKIPIK
jgi:hypothetical protein